jgi:diacylglycerol kinase family enzyme
VFHLVGCHQKAISRISLNFLGSGLDARVIARHRRQKIPVPGKLSYFFHGFQELCRLKPFRLSGEIDGKPFKSLSNIIVLGLGRFFGGGMMITHPKVLNSLAQKVKIVVDPPGLVEADGELIGWTPLEVEVCLQAFRVAAKKISFSTS